MKDTGTTSVEREALHSQIEKLNRSSILHGSESLCKLLKYLGEHSLDAPGMSLKEYQIATEVFGRPADFDSRMDSTVRVQTGRLRSKLAEYYAGEGAPDRMVIEIPKGAFFLTFHVAEPRETHALMAPHAGPPGRTRGSARSERAVLSAFVVLPVHRDRRSRGSGGRDRGDPLHGVAAGRHERATLTRAKDLLERLCQRSGCALGRLQQRRVRRPAGDGSPLFQSGTGRWQGDSGPLHGCGRGNGRPRSRSGVCEPET